MFICNLCFSCSIHLLRARAQLTGRGNACHRRSQDPFPASPVKGSQVAGNVKDWPDKKLKNSCQPELTVMT